MKKILLISYFFDQDQGIGSMRSQGLAKYLSKFGWDLTIITAKKPSSFPYVDIIEVPFESKIYKWKKKFGFNLNRSVKDNLADKGITGSNKYKKNIINFSLHLFEEVFMYPDEQNGWDKAVLRSINDLLENETFDAVISTSLPLTSHIIAFEIKKKYNIPWIADLRDLWSQNHYYNFSTFRKVIDNRLELKTLSAANALTTTSSLLAKKLTQLHKRSDIYAIPNGFDPDITNENLPLTNKLTITYTGLLYNGKRDPSPLFKVLRDLNDEKEIDLNDFSIDLYVYDEIWLRDEIRKYGLEEYVKIHGLIPRQKVLKKQWRSQLLLLLMWDNPNEVGIIPGKVFEYLAAKRPILSFGPQNSLIKELIEFTNSGSYVSNYLSIKEAIKRYYHEFKLNGEIEYKGIDNKIDKYSQIEMAKKFAEVLNSVITK